MDERAIARSQWAGWVATAIGGDAAQQAAALDAAMAAMDGGLGGSAAEAAARRAAAAAGPAIAGSMPAGVMRCRFCGSVPAIAATIHEHNGFLIWFVHRTIRGPFCRDCGLSAVRRMVNATLLRGWIGWISFFVAPVTALLDLVVWLRLRSLDAPQPHPDGGIAPAGPGRPIVARPGVYVYAGMLAVLAVFASQNWIGAGGCASGGTMSAKHAAYQQLRTDVDSHLAALARCSSNACGTPHLEAIANSHDEFAARLVSMCFSNSSAAHAAALERASRKVATAARSAEATQADAGGFDAVNAAMTAFYEANATLNHDLGITVLTTPSP